MILTTCDQCGTRLERAEQAWFGVNYTPAPEPLNEAEMIPLLELTTDHEFHFCSAACLSSWSFAFGLEGVEAS